MELIINTRNKYVLADREKTKDILYEILTNSFKASKEGSKVVIICKEEFDSQGNVTPFLKVRIRDQGVGIARGDLAHISEDFLPGGKEN
ncbi:MAG: sensor histidine kinase [Candidatus Omnitrophica bacterium]|nr:sensor histidine kinase [Candidatus Omnitrophota bacterium]